MRLKDKVAIVTGAARGIGKAIAERFVAEGAIVVIADILEELGEETAKSLSPDGAKAVFMKTDVTSEEMVNKTVSETVDRFGRIDILVNNAGILTKMVSIEDTTMEFWDMVVNLQLRGPFMFMRAVTPFMKKQKYGKMISIASSAGIAPREGMIPYSSSKAGLIMATKVAAKELAEYGICANVVAPGTIENPVMPEELREVFIKLIPNKKFGHTGDIAAAVTFLASSEADQIVGAVLSVDGGRLLM